MAEKKFIHKVTFKIDEIRSIHSNVEIVGGLLHIKGKIRGEDMERIDELWPRSIYVDSVTGTYNVQEGIPVTIGRLTGKVEVKDGVKSKPTIHYKSKKKLKKFRRSFFKKLRRSKNTEDI